MRTSCKRKAIAVCTRKSKKKSGFDGLSFYLFAFFLLFFFVFLVCFPFSLFGFPFVCFIFRYFSASYVLMWKDFQDSISPHLLGVVDEVKQIFFVARADGTVRAYLGGFNSWKRWAKSNGLPYLPTNSFHVAMYLQVILQSASSASLWTTQSTI